MKKAQIFGIGMVLLVVGAMIGILIAVNTVATATSPYQSIGQRAFELQDTYSKADLFVSFISGAARWSSAEVVQTLGANGGHLDVSFCGYFGNANFWNNPEKRIFCFPRVYDNFYELTKKKINTYSANYANIKQIPYELLVSDNTLQGIATVPIRLNIMAPSEKTVYYNPYDLFGIWTVEYKHDKRVSGIYVFRPDFKIPFNYNLGIYEKLTAAAENIVFDCSDIIDDKEICARAILDEELKNEKVTINIAQDKDVFVFKISQDDKKSIYTGGKAPVIEFALELTPTD